MRTNKYKTISILSLSLLTVMAGAAVAPALGIIKENFADENPLFIQMIISIPALVIIITNLIFPKLCKYFRSKTLVITGLFLYIAGGCAAGLCDNIFLLLAARALVGIGVGIIMPLSTGLLAFYFAPEMLERLMGYSSAMNQMGGAIATLLSGLLATISWRASFLVYALGLPCFILCLIFLPNDDISASGGSASGSGSSSIMSTLRENISCIISMFLLMVTFFIYPANFAIITSAEGIIPQSAISVIMAGMDLIAFVGGLAFIHLKRIMNENIRFLSPILFLLGYLLLTFIGGWFGSICGSLLIGFANGEGIPHIIASASKRAGKLAATTVMPLISSALYLGQFLTPLLTSAASAVFGTSVLYLPYFLAIVSAVLFAVTSKDVK